jgi:hypothetical protein
VKLSDLIKHLQQLQQKYEQEETNDREIRICIDFEGTQYDVLLTDVAYSSRTGVILISEDGSIGE